MLTLGSFYAADSLKLQTAFAKLDEKLQDGILRPIATAASKVVAEAERAAAPKESGLLAEAIGVSTTRTYRASGSSRLFVAAGVRQGYRRTATITKAGKLGFDRSSRPESGDEGARDPVKYLHLVTGGRSAVRIKDSRVLHDWFRNRFLGPQVAAARPNPFMQRAYDQVAPQIAAQAAADGQAAVEQIVGSG